MGESSTSARPRWRGSRERNVADDQRVVGIEVGRCLGSLARGYLQHLDANRRDFADLRVFNAAGEAVPIAFGAEPEPSREALPAVALPMFPINAAPGERAISGKNLDVVVRSNSDGTIVSVQDRSTRGAPRRSPKRCVTSFRIG